MSDKPLIGLTTYPVNEKNEYYLLANYVDAVRRAGGVPLLMPPGEREVEVYFSVISALILTGGGDITPSCYQGKAHEMHYNMSRERDDFEIAMAKYAIAFNVPTLGICRGMQIINVAQGGSLIAHIPEVYGERILHRAPPREPIAHIVNAFPNSLLESVVKERQFNVSSWHHQAIENLSPTLEVCAYSPDGVIEAVQMPTHKWLLAVQWHPELTAANDSIQQKLFAALINMVS